jgi:hypothetical protein
VVPSCKSSSSARITTTVDEHDGEADINDCSKQEAISTLQSNCERISPERAHEPPLDHVMERARRIFQGEFSQLLVR